MPSFTLTLLISFSLVFVIEGLIYALFPDALKRLMAMVQTLPPQQIRIFGLLMAATGVAMVYFFKAFAAR